MMVDVSFDLFFGDSADGATEIAACPQMLSPIALFEQRELILQFARRNAFDVLGNLGGTQAGRTRHHQMNMIGADMPFQDRHFTTHTDLTNDFACALGGFTA